VIINITSFVQQHKTKAIPVVLQTLKSWKQHTASKSAAAWDFTKFHATESKAKIVRDHKRRRLRKLPWYAVVGNPHSGKRTMIKNTGLVFVRPEHFGEDAINYMNQAPDIEWWFSEQAV
jgi:type VI secretion system protein ImpL